MGSSMDFIKSLDPDMSIKILMCLDDPSDLDRVSSVSRFWRHFEVGSSYLMKWEALQRDHRVYAYLARASISSAIGDCISEAYGASSTDHYPEESIDNTLEPRVIVAQRASYWSSKGQSNPDVSESLFYKLVNDFCVINEIKIQPFQDFFEMGYPIYSAKSVRFKMGHPKTSRDVKADLMCKSSHVSADDQFIWTYTSQEFPMAQENRLQKFKLPEPVLCIGGFLQIELLGRVLRHEMDGLFYICVSHVQVVGRSLSPAFGVEILEPSGKFVLKNDRLLRCPTQSSLSANEPNAVSADYFQRRVRDLQHIVNLSQGNLEVIEPLEWDGEEDEDADFEEEYAM
ncbi:F-box protein [Quillaja saponaria]|uniref:F-box protein n=1 Tax=Quillaja saponaria TaxID=32244 RepID=A0AAD7PZ95_QUISA|nr:F-box protein [Quillaja saponaria]